MKFTGKAWISSRKTEISFLSPGYMVASHSTSNSTARPGGFHPPNQMQMPAPIRAPTFLSRRRLFEQNLADLHKCTDLNQLKRMHALIYKFNLHDDPFVAPKLISAFSLCRQMALAVKVFDQIPSPNARLCNTLVKAYIRNSEPAKAFEIFCRMRWSGIAPDNHTYPILLKVCSGLRFTRMIHAQVEKCNFYWDLFVPNSLIDAYSKCGLIGVREGKKVFDLMEERDLVTYNSVISGLVKEGELQEARKLFDEMPHTDTVSWNAILDGYVTAGDMIKAFEHFEKMPSRNVVSWSTLIFGYVKTGDLEMAKALFDSMPVKNLVTWTIMISGYAEKGLAKVAIGLYNQMERARFEPDEGAFISILSACAESGLLGLGKKVHKSIMESRGNKCGTAVTNALIDMYCKCGLLNKAWRIFNMMETKDLVSWNAMIHGLAIHGHGRKALHLFDQMKREGFAPDNVTFISVLFACSHAGLFEDGVNYFYSMESNYKISPQIEHYGCVIDLLGRGGHLAEAFRLLQEMPFKPNAAIWGSLLGACRMHNAVQLAEVVLNQLIKLEPVNAGAFAMLSNMYAAAGDWEGVADARLQMRMNGRASGVSSIELNDEVHEFTVTDMTHPKSDGIYKTVNQLDQHLRKTACTPNLMV